MGQFSEWYRSKRWKARRSRQLSIHPLCVMCAAGGRVVVATIADHVVPHKGNYDLFLHGKLQSLCSTCHSSMKQSHERGGQSVAIGVDGWPIEKKT